MYNWAGILAYILIWDKWILKCQTLKKMSHNNKLVGIEIKIKLH